MCNAEKWEAFGRAILEGWPEPRGAELDEFELFEIAEKHGVLVGEKVTEPCSDYCNCWEAGFPTVCYHVLAKDT